MAVPRVLVIDDDHDIRRLMVTVLRRNGLEGIEAGDGPEGIRAFFEQRPSLVVLDLGLPGLDGWEVLDRIRELSDAPVVILSAEGREAEKVRGFASGADDYVTKPFGPEELLARIRSLIQRSGASRAQPLVLADDGLVLDEGRRTVEVRGRPVHLTPTEFDLLVALIRNRDQVVTQQQLLEIVWGNQQADPKRVRLYVSYLRRKLREAGDLDPIETVRGLGYRFRPARSPGRDSDGRPSPDALTP